MPTPEIPGYYYDETKKKYFKITNGSLSIHQKYHNNQVQLKKRRIQFEKGSPVTSNKSDTQINRNIYLQLLRNRYQKDLINIRLGLVNIETNTEYLFNILKNLKLPRSIIFNREVGIIQSLKDKLVINDFNTSIKIITMQNLCEKNLHSSNAFHDIKIENYYNRLSRVNNFISPRLTSICISNDLIFKSIVMHEINSNISLNFVKLHLRNSDSEESDLTLHVFKSCSNLRDKMIRGKLNSLFGCNMVTINGNSYFYTAESIYDSGCFVTFSKFMNGQLVIGSNNGDVFWIKFGSNHDFNKVRFKNVSKYSISKIRFYDNKWFVGNGSNVSIYDKQLNFKKKLCHTSEIKNFALLESMILLIGLKGLIIMNLVDSNSATQLDYTNHNIVNQISRIIANNLIINESNSNILIYNLKTMESFRIDMNINSQEKLRDISVTNNETNLVIRTTNNLTDETRFLIYNL